MDANETATELNFVQSYYDQDDRHNILVNVIQPSEEANLLNPIVGALGRTVSMYNELMTSDVQSDSITDDFEVISDSDLEI